MFKDTTSNYLVVLLSVCIQVPLAIFLGHYYDQRSFLDTGYLVFNGLNPYQTYNITVFSNPNLIGNNPIIGYPPLWPLLTGAIYGLTYNLLPNIFLYNFALKIPIILGNIGLAYVTREILRQQNLPEKHVRYAWLFLLFNPLFLLTSTAWGEFDTLIALLCVPSLYFLSKGMVEKSGLLLALSVVLKPISFPLIGLPLVFPLCKNRKKILSYISILILAIVVLWLLPFNLLSWMAPSSPDQVTSYFRMAGGMTPFNIVEIVQDSAILPSALAFLGYLWIPALLIGYAIVLRNPPKSFTGLAKSAVVLLLIFSLTRSWLSEPNIVLVLALTVIALSSTDKSFKNFHFLWVIPLVFTVFNTSLFQLFFLAWPPVIPALAQWDLTIRTSRLIMRFLIVVAFQFFAWRLLVKFSKERTV